MRPISPFSFFFFLIIRRPPRSTLFPYTTLFRSQICNHGGNLLVDLQPENPERRHKVFLRVDQPGDLEKKDRKSTRLNSSHRCISYAVFCLKKKKLHAQEQRTCDD